MRPSSTSRSAFTVVELLVVLAVIAAMLWLLTPTGRGCKGKSPDVACQNNLKQIALAHIVWVYDHEQSAPSFRVGWWNGGSSPGPFGQARADSSGPEPAWVLSGLADASWFQFAWISNELVSPRVLVCSSDRDKKRPTKNFGSNRDGGFLNASFRDNAVSYLLFLDCGYPWTPVGKVTTWENASESPLLADRNLAVESSVNDKACASGVRSSGYVSLPAETRWIQQKHFGHGDAGNVALIDGSVQRTRGRELNELFRHDNDSGRVHLLAPQ